MASVPMGELHATVHVPHATTPAPFPPTATGKVELLTIWNEYVPYDGIYLPFVLQAGDYIVFINRPIDDPATKLQVEGLTLEFYGGHSQPALLSGGVYLLRVVDEESRTELSLSGAGRMKVFMAVYRGLNASDVIGTDLRDFGWNDQGTQLVVHREPLPYSAPEAEIATVTFATMPPALSTFGYQPDHGYWQDIISADDYDIEPNRQVTLNFNSRDDLSPVEDLQAYSTGGWDPAYEDGWGGAKLYTYIFMTQQVDYLPDDPGNPAPAGNAHLPIRGL